MYKLNYDKLKKESDFINNTIHEINKFDILRNRIEYESSIVIESNFAKAIFNREKDIFSLSNEEMFSLLDLLYKKIKDERLNPSNYKLNAKEVSIDKAQQKMYNPEFKEKFLDDHVVNDKNYSDDTKRVIRSLFGKIGDIERYNNQDIYEFNRQSFETVLKDLKATTLRSLQNSVSKLEQYIAFAIKEGKVDPDKRNITTRYRTGDELKNFLDKQAFEKMIFTKQSIDAISMYANNAQDGVILNLLFDGVSHKRKFIELRSITINHCDFEKMVINIPQLVDEDTGEILPPRDVPISVETERMIRNAMIDEKYVSLKGQATRAYTIADSKFILRGLRNNPQIKWENVGQRIVRISEVLNYTHLNATNVAYSGQIHYVRKLIEEEELNIDEACRRIIQRFNIGENESAFFYLKARIEKVNRTFE